MDIMISAGKASAAPTRPIPVPTKTPAEAKDTYRQASPPQAHCAASQLVIPPPPTAEQQAAKQRALSQAMFMASSL